MGGYVDVRVLGIQKVTNIHHMCEWTFKIS